MNAMKGLGIDNADASPESVMSMMQGMMTNLLSKDILYPSLKEIQERVSQCLLITRIYCSSSGSHNDLIVIEIRRGLAVVPHFLLCSAPFLTFRVPCDRRLICRRVKISIAFWKFNLWKQIENIRLGFTF